MAPRANWKGFLQVGELSCAVALYTAVSTSERISFHMVNRDTGHRLRREYVDSETGKPVDRDDQVKGYDLGEGEFVVLEPEEVAAVIPEADKTLDLDTFVACSDIDGVFFDRPYYLAPADRQAREVFALIRDGMKAANVAALAETVLFRKARTLLIRAHGKGLIATTLNYDYEVRSADKAFKQVKAPRLDDEMLELATHIIKMKRGEFDPAEFDDRYEEALAELVKAKIEGRKIRKPPRPKKTRPDDLLEALRKSAANQDDKPQASRRRRKAS